MGLPKSLSFFKDYAVSTIIIILGLVMRISVIVGYGINPAAVAGLAGNLNPIIGLYLLV